MKFKLIIDEEIEIDREKIREKVRLMAINKDKISLFNFGDLEKSEEDEKMIEHIILKLDTQNYKDKWLFLEGWFQIKDEDNQIKNLEEES